MLPFTAEVLYSNLEQYNAAVWPAQVIALGLGLLAVFLALKPTRGGGRLIAAVLTVAWAWVGVAYHLSYFDEINFAAPAYGLVFVLQALLLAWSGLIRGRLAFAFQSGVSGWTGLAFVLYALGGVPLVEWLVGHGWPAMPLFGVAPGPTVMATMGLLLLTPGRPLLHLLAIPVLWSLASGAMAWLLATPQGLVLPATALGALGLAVWTHVRQARI